MSLKHVSPPYLLLIYDVTLYSLYLCLLRCMYTCRYVCGWKLESPEKSVNLLYPTLRRKETFKQDTYLNFLCSHV